MKSDVDRAHDPRETGRSQALRPVVALITGETVEVGSIFCIGRNYATHAREMGSEPPSQPFFFFKPVTSLIGSGGRVEIPEISNDLHHEIELVFLLDRPMRNVSETEASRGISAVAVGLDMTMRDVQARAKEEGKPWSLAKGFDTSAPVGRFLPVDKGSDLGRFSFDLKVNEEVRQRGESGDMLFSPGQIVSWLSRNFTLRPGDLVFSGTPEGVAQVVEGDRLVAELVGHEECRLEVTVTRQKQVQGAQ